EAEHLDELVAAVLVLAPPEPVRHAVQVEGLHDGQVDVQLPALSHHEPELPQELRVPSRRRVPEDLDPTRGGGEEAREALERRRLPGAVRSEEAEHLSAAGREGDVLDGGHGTVLALQDRTQCSLEAWLTDGHLELPDEILDDDHDDPLVAADQG